MSYTLRQPQPKFGWHGIAVSDIPTKLAQWKQPVVDLYQRLLNNMVIMPTVYTWEIDSITRGAFIRTQGDPDRAPEAHFLFGPVAEIGGIPTYVGENHG